MKQIYLRHITPYLVDGDSFNIKYDTSRGNIYSDDETGVSFGMYSHRWYNGATNLHEYKNHLFITFCILVKDINVLEQIVKSNELIESENKNLKKILFPIDSFYNAEAEKLIKLFRWLTDIPFDQNKKGDYIPLAWSTDKTHWKNIIWDSVPNYVFTGMLGNDITNVVNGNVIKELIIPNLHLTEPLCHDILHEAKNLLDTNNIRAAFIVGFTALEIGVKEYIQAKIPDTQWLIQESPSPDILKICSKYLPSIDKDLELDKYEKNLLKKYMENRNKIIHKGILEENLGTVVKKLYMVEYMLHRFDYSNGIERAKLYAEKAKDEMLHLGLDGIS